MMSAGGSLAVTIGFMAVGGRGERDDGAVGDGDGAGREWSGPFPEARAEATTPADHDEDGDPEHDEGRAPKRQRAGSGGRPARTGSAPGGGRSRDP